MWCLPADTKSYKICWRQYQLSKGKLAFLAGCGLIGILHLMLEMNEDEVVSEIHSTFKQPIKGNPVFCILKFSCVMTGNSVHNECIKNAEGCDSLHLSYFRYYVL